MPSSSQHDIHRAYDQLEKVANDIRDLIFDFDISKYPWEQLLNKYYILNKNLDTIQSIMKKEDSNFKMSLLHPKDGNLENLTQLTEKLSVYTHDLQKTKETKSEDFPQISSSNLSNMNNEELQNRRSRHDELASHCFSCLEKQKKKVQSTIKKKDKTTSFHKVFNIDDSKDLLPDTLLIKHNAIRKQSKMKNILLESILTGKELNNTVIPQNTNNINYLRDVYKGSIPTSAPRSKFVASTTEDPFKPNIINNTSTMQQGSNTKQQQQGGINIKTVTSSGTAGSQNVNTNVNLMKKEPGTEGVNVDIKKEGVNKPPTNLRTNTTAGMVNRGNGMPQGTSPMIKKENVGGVTGPNTNTTNINTGGNTPITAAGRGRRNAVTPTTVTTGGGSGRTTPTSGVNTKPPTNGNFFNTPNNGVRGNTTTGTDGLIDLTTQGAALNQNRMNNTNVGGVVNATGINPNTPRNQQAMGMGRGNQTPTAPTAGVNPNVMMFPTAAAMGGNFMNRPGNMIFPPTGGVYQIPGQLGRGAPNMFGPNFLMRGAPNPMYMPQFYGLPTTATNPTATQPGQQQGNTNPQQQQQKK
ncbi:hypothetical protein ABK040_005476 [Willaertia magna]